MTTYESSTKSNGRYVLVEYLSDGGYYCYGWYNLVTGDKDVLPTFPYNAKLKEIRNENDIVFTTDGVIEPIGAKYFPKIVECCRFQEVLGSENDFYQTLEKFYLPIDQGFDMGTEAHETIRDIKVSLEGAEVLFGPMKGHEIDFYSGTG